MNHAVSEKLGIFSWVVQKPLEIITTRGVENAVKVVDWAVGKGKYSNIKENQNKNQPNEAKDFDWRKDSENDENTNGKMKNEERKRKSGSERRKYEPRFL